MRWLGSSVRLWFVIIVLLGALWVYLASRNDPPEPTNGAVASLVAREALPRMIGDFDRPAQADQPRLEEERAS